MPQFAPVRVRGGRYRWHRPGLRRGRVLAAGLVVTAAVLVAAAVPGEPAEGERGGRARGHPVAERPPERPVEKVTAPVRIADGATVRLLRPGDRVDVIAAPETATGGDARVVARGALVAELPEPVDEAGGGALVVLSVPRSTAAQLVGAGVTARLAVTLC